MAQVPEFKVENLVTLVTFDNSERIDLNDFVRKSSESDYNPERFPGVIIRINKPKGTALLFSTRKMIITGVKSVREAETITSLVVKKARKSRIVLENPDISVKNIVATSDLKMLVDLDACMVSLEDAMYEPEIFPGLIYRIHDPKSVLLIFSTGKIICTGCRSEEDIGKSIVFTMDNVREVMDNFNESAGEIGLVS